MQKRFSDYVSPNVEKLLGITVEQIRKDIAVLGELVSGGYERSIRDDTQRRFRFMNSRNGILSMFIRKQENDAGFIVLQWVVRQTEIRNIYWLCRIVLLDKK